MIKPHGADTLKPLFAYDTEQHHALLAEAETLPQLLVSSAAAANAVMLGAGYFTPLDGYMNLADSLCVAREMKTTGGLFWPVPIINMVKDADGIAVWQSYCADRPQCGGQSRVGNYGCGSR